MLRYKQILKWSPMKKSTKLKKSWTDKSKVDRRNISSSGRDTTTPKTHENQGSTQELSRKAPSISPKEPRFDQSRFDKSGLRGAELNKEGSEDGDEVSADG